MFAIRNLIIARFSLAFSFTFIACQTLTIEKIPETAEPAQEIAATESQLDDASHNQVDILSPEYFKKAEDRLNEAKQCLSESAPTPKTLRFVAESRANLKRAKRVADYIRQAMPEVVKAREEAVAAHASELVAKTLVEADKSLVGVTSAVEDDTDYLPSEMNRDKLKKAYQAVEIAAIKEDNLNQVRQTMTQAIKEGAKERAPRTYQIASDSLRQADEFIDHNPHEPTGITAAALRARMDVDHLLKITRDTRVINEQDAESIALAKERQEKELVAEKDAAAKAAERLEHAQGTVASMREQNLSLTSENAFNEMFNGVASRFEANQVEVLRNGNRLTLRLKSLHFPSGKATLQSEDYDLLAAVRDVVLDFAPATVTIQGHTDSIGGSDTNLKLSLGRANAVQEYFATNGLHVNSIQMQALGYGDQQPIASNKTANGRAQNRRVDVIIQPEATTLSH